MIGEATYIACRRKQQLLPSTKQELPAWIYVRGKVQFKSMCCLEGIECTLCTVASFRAYKIDRPPLRRRGGLRQINICRKVPFQTKRFWIAFDESYPSPDNR